MPQTRSHNTYSEEPDNIIGKIMEPTMKQDMIKDTTHLKQSGKVTIGLTMHHTTLKYRLKMNTKQPRHNGTNEMPT